VLPVVTFVEEAVGEESETVGAVVVPVVPEVSVTEDGDEVAEDTVEVEAIALAAPFVEAGADPLVAAALAAACTLVL